MVNSRPLVSIVIPTLGRPAYLSRAIQSVLECQLGSIEVIVIPNGPDMGWCETLKPLVSDERFHISPLEIANVSAARNQGMALARGEYLRFLDDDDYLLTAAGAQLEMMEHTGADVCSGPLLNVDEDGVKFGVNSVPTHDDFVCAAVGLSGFRLPHGNLWRRRTVQTCLWDASIREGEDYSWMLDLAAAREWHWTKVHQPVGVWFHHRGPRGSSMRTPTDRREGVMSHLFGLHRQLAATERLTTDRRKAIANAMWQYAHAGFPSHPLYWSRVARWASAIDPTSHPPDALYTTAPFRKMSPILGEWALLPSRTVRRLAREMSFLWRDRDYRRQL